MNSIIVLLGFVLLSNVYAQSYCEPPVRGIYESGPELRNIFSYAKADNIEVDVQDDVLLEPGKQAGKFFINSSLKDLKSKIPVGGGLAKKNPFSNNQAQYFESYAQGLGFYFEQGKLVLIRVSNEDYKTRTGYALNSSEQELSNLKNCQRKDDRLQCNGIAFTFFDEAVKTVHIFPKNN